MPSTLPRPPRRPRSSLLQAPATATSGEWSPVSNVDPDAPPSSRPLWRRLPLQWLIVGGLFAAGGVGGLLFNASRSSSGEITKAGDLGATELRVGDCFDLKGPDAEELEDVAAKPCTAEHEYELFFIGDMTDSSFPTDQAFDAFLESNCVDAFQAYVGKTYQASELEVSSIVPTEAVWGAGDHSVQCAVYHPRIHRLAESLKGSAR